MGKKFHDSFLRKILIENIVTFAGEKSNFNTSFWDQTKTLSRAKETGLNAIQIEGLLNFQRQECFQCQKPKGGCVVNKNRGKSSFCCPMKAFHNLLFTITFC